MNTLEILIKARELIADPSKWTKGAQTKHRQPGLNPEIFTVQHCAVGALRNAGNGNRIKEASAALREVIPCDSIFEYNDGGTHKCVLAAFDAAIEKQKAAK